MDIKNILDMSEFGLFNVEVGGINIYIPKNTTFDQVLDLQKEADGAKVPEDKPPLFTFEALVCMHPVIRSFEQKIKTLKIGESTDCITDPETVMVVHRVSDRLFFGKWCNVHTNVNVNYNVNELKRENTKVQTHTQKQTHKRKLICQ